MTSVRTLLKHSAVFWSVVVTLAALAAAVGFLKVLPGRSALAAAVERAEENVDKASKLEATAAGPHFDRGVEDFVQGRRARAQRFDAERQRSASALSAWFTGLRSSGDAGAGGRPARDEFQRDYAFHRDRLNNAIRDILRKSGGPETARTATMEPDFLNGEPPKDAVMTHWQRLANIERMLLEAAARNGAYALRALEIETEAAPLGDPDRNYSRYRVRAALGVPTRRTAATLAALIHAGDEVGVIGRLVGIAVEPAPVDDSSEADPPVHLSLAMTLGFPVAPGEEALK